MAVPLTALPRRVFFTTWYSQPTARNSRRSLLSLSTVSPRKSARIRLCAAASRVFKVSILAFFSVAFTMKALLVDAEFGDERGRIDLDPRPHRGGESDRLHVRALGRSRLQLHQRFDHDTCVFVQLVAAERCLADTGMNHARLLDTKLRSKTNSRRSLPPTKSAASITSSPLNLTSPAPPATTNSLATSPTSGAPKASKMSSSAATTSTAAIQSSHRSKWSHPFITAPSCAKCPCPAIPT